MITILRMLILKRSESRIKSVRKIVRRLKVYLGVGGDGERIFVVLIFPVEAGVRELDVKDTSVVADGEEKPVLTLSM